jgi:hypothetical protein
MLNLPIEIKRRIYSFDSTYFNEFNKVLFELLNVTCLWEIIFNKNLDNNLFSIEKNYNLSFEFTNNYMNFWNFNILVNYPDYYINLIRNKNRMICYNRSLMDYKKKEFWFNKILYKIKKNKIIKYDFDIKSI